MCDLIRPFFNRGCFDYRCITCPIMSECCSVFEKYMVIGFIDGGEEMWDLLTEEDKKMVKDSNRILKPIAHLSNCKMDRSFDARI